MMCSPSLCPPPPRLYAISYKGLSWKERKSIVEVNSHMPFGSLWGCYISEIRKRAQAESQTRWIILPWVRQEIDTSISARSGLIDRKLCRNMEKIEVSLL